MQQSMFHLNRLDKTENGFLIKIVINFHFFVPLVKTSPLARLLILTEFLETGQSEQRIV